jgi:hypothetical protein
MSSGIRHSDPRCCLEDHLSHVESFATEPALNTTSRTLVETSLFRGWRDDQMRVHFRRWLSTLPCTNLGTSTVSDATNRLLESHGRCVANIRDALSRNRIGIQRQGHLSPKPLKLSRIKTTIIRIHRGLY